MNICIMSDEVSTDLDTALELIASWGVPAVELRAVGGGRYPDVSDYWKYRVPQLLAEYGLTVAGISPGLFKLRNPGPHAPMYFNRGGDARQWEIERDAEATLDKHITKLLPASIEAAQRLGSPQIICFGFDQQTDGPAPELVVQILRRAAEKVGEAGLQLNLEVQDWASRSADLVRRVNHPAFGISWTPASAYASGDDVPFPDGYNHVRPYVRHVHFKDVKTDPGGRKPIMDGTLDTTGKKPWVLDGVIDWKGQIAALREDGYTGYFSVEPHVRPQVNAAMKTLARLRALLAETESVAAPAR
jgi:sugar phosphate isomerase/epimerase